MPELPEVEVVRAGLAHGVTGARVSGVEVFDARALKRHRAADADARSRMVVDAPTRRAAERASATEVFSDASDSVADFERRLLGVKLGTPTRRGKFLWMPITPRTPPLRLPTALLAHLGMSGQLLLRSVEHQDDRHVRVRVWLEHAEHGELRLDFADQRLFGSLAIDTLIQTPDSAPGGVGALEASIPRQASHIARDPLDPAFNDQALIVALRNRKAAIKAVILDQSLVSGVGNIYADEALWIARIHPETPSSTVSTVKARRLLGAIREVFQRALAEGGTSFDTQYVNVNGESGYFAHSLNAYGRSGKPCTRCGASIKRVPFAGRSSHFCPRCQRKR